MAFEFKLPDIGEGVVEGEIVKWLVKAGDAIDVDQPMVEVMTDKATVVIPSPKKGTVTETRGAEGDMIAVDEVIVVIEEGAAPAAPAPAPPPAPAAPPPAPPPPAPAAPPPPPVAPPPPPAVPVAAPAPVVPAGGKVLAAPATRRLARELGFDISIISGTGPAGRVTSDDVRRASGAAAPVAATPPPPAPAAPVAARPAAPPPPPPAAGAEDQRIPVRGLRRRIWDKMAQSAFTAAHFTFVEECDCTELVKMRGRYNGNLVEGEPKLNYLPFIAKAVLVSLKRFPQMNGHVDDDQMEYIQRADFHLGIAVASDRGLVVPVVRHADRKSLLELEQEIRRLADAVRTGSLSQSDLGGSTFTITSLGKEGGIFATPIINYPEVAIMGVHKMSKKPMVVDDEIKIRSMMNLSLSFDHRLIDGHVGAAFTYSVIKLLQAPDRLMMEI